jgi:hypothetical protein
MVKFPELLSNTSYMTTLSVCVFILIFEQLVCEDVLQYKAINFILCLCVCVCLTVCSNYKTLNRFGIRL